MQDLAAELKTQGYAIVRGFLSPAETSEIASEVDKMYREGLKHHATYRDGNLLFEVLDDPKARRRVVLQAHWTAWISPLMERMRRSEKYLAVREPFLGKDIKQITHQIHWKPPGAKYFLSLSSGCALQGRQDQGFRSPREHRDHRARDRPAD